jgi:hypothetical protein
MWIRHRTAFLRRPEPLLNDFDPFPAYNSDLAGASIPSFSFSPSTLRIVTTVLPPMTMLSSERLIRTSLLHLPAFPSCSPISIIYPALIYRPARFAADSGKPREHIFAGYPTRGLTKPFAQQPIDQ